MGHFKYGLETEYIVCDRDSFQPFWHRELSFDRLNAILEGIPLDGIPSLENLELEPPHRKLMPYVVEGYHLPDAEFNPKDILPKGVEIRTPVCQSIEECLRIQKLLFDRLQEHLSAHGLVAIALSHHPIESQFVGPQNKRRHDFWLWAMEVMTTYGPDINIGIPSSMMQSLDLEDFTKKINYYAPAMTAFSVASPFCQGKLWEVHGQVGKSFRTYRRSVIAPPIEIHPKENNRLEFKVFDMSPYLQDYECFFLLFLTLLLDTNLQGRESNASRIYNQGAVALNGWDSPFAVERAEELLASAANVLPSYGMDTRALRYFEERLRNRITPADEIIGLYRENGNNLNSVLKHLSILK